MREQPSPAFQTTAEEYVTYWQKLSARGIRLIEKIADPSMRYESPLGTAASLDGVEAMLEKLFARVDQAKFRVTDTAWGGDGYTFYMRWMATFVLRGKRRQWTVRGLSEVMLNPHGKIVHQIDQWDTGEQILARLPLVSRFFGFVMKKVRLS